VYTVSFIDEFSRNIWIYSLENKSKFFDIFKEFKALLENQTKKTIKCRGNIMVENYVGINLKGFVRSML